MGTIVRVNPKEAEALLESNKSIRILDVRTKEEYEQQHFPGAEHIGVEEVTSNGIPYAKETPVLITCNHGLKKSDASAQYLAAHGYSKIYILDGGLQAWFGS